MKAKENKKERGGRQCREPSVAASPQPWRQVNAAALAELNRITQAHGLLSDQHLQF
ncbi:MULTISPECIES: type II toxin-antitoxin system CcdA family antitoxin [unclassified Pantoea]|uniref:type II toxin-antitoxin system CcdA family antitoxin n=1 Tax=unclassified Pantoea TaxID=2630326 RepID=UPI000ACDBD57|nr:MULTISPECIES: type II toxin-antitoxin system CcdA family antitoxin [unclassified Pantoea]MDU6389544.1 type II toxin-antitoxin system CcdA family antitoxin [Pantoea sp.]